MIATRHGLLRAAAVTVALGLAVFGLAAAPASAAPTPTTSVQAAGPSTGAWTAGGLIGGVSQPATSALSAGNGFASVGGCVFYASSTYAGGYCPSGGYSYDGPQRSFCHRRQNCARGDQAKYISSVTLQTVVADRQSPSPETYGLFRLGGWKPGAGLFGVNSKHGSASGGRICGAKSVVTG